MILDYQSPAAGWPGQNNASNVFGRSLWMTIGMGYDSETTVSRRKAFVSFWLSLMSYKTFKIELFLTLSLLRFYVAYMDMGYYHVASKSFLCGFQVLLDLLATLRQILLQKLLFCQCLTWLFLIWIKARSYVSSTHALKQWQHSWIPETRHKLHAIESMVNVINKFHLPRWGDLRLKLDTCSTVFRTCAVYWYCCITLS